MKKVGSFSEGTEVVRRITTTTQREDERKTEKTVCDLAKMLIVGDKSVNEVLNRLEADRKYFRKYKELSFDEEDYYTALFLVGKVGKALEDIPSTMKTEEICLTAVLNDKEAWQFVPKGRGMYESPKEAGMFERICFFVEQGREPHNVKGFYQSPFARYDSD